MKIPSKHFFTAFFLLLISGNTSSAEQRVITDDGREVQINDDGSWLFLTTDRFANTSDGRRIRLKDDGRWQYTKDAPIKFQEENITTGLNITLEKVVVEKYEKKVQKNTRVKTQTVFYCQLENLPQTKASYNFKDDDLSLIEVKDNNGKIYPTLSIKTDAENMLIVRAEKSPAFLDDAKSMQITFKAGIFDLKNPITLNQRIIDFDELDVDGFE